ncbi:MAG: uracil-DNA glycosylase [Bacteroidetes bacterium]|jgi:uracil-DNA glycosylase|nr:uracil-DNA glycosylase [Bacteroidota bacterium]
MVDPQIHESWKEPLKEEFSKDYFQKLKEFLVEEKKNCVIYPPGKLIFSAFNFTPFDQIKVVIIGQDPYHGPGQANGFCFSVNDGVRFPPSLHNIFKELKSDCGCEIPLTGNLEPWAKQGVFLLNATLTVRQNTAGSHQNKGWEQFTDAVIRLISERREHVVFMLWGNYAKAKSALIDSSKHLILEAAHPSPLARGAFFGCKHFSKANNYLKGLGKQEIHWCL